MFRSNNSTSRLALVAASALVLSQASPAAIFSIPFNALNFSHPLRINNPFFALKAGTQQVFSTKTDEGCELDRMTITNDSRKIAGVTARVVHDVVFSDEQCNGNLTKAEDTQDYYAQDDKGNVWYLGEISKNCDGDQCSLDEGSWIGGEDIANIGTNAKPGLVMLANPEDGVHYRQEFYAGHAQDEAIVTDDNVTVRLQFSNAIDPGIFHKCIKTKEFTALEPDVVGFKYYCPNIGLVLETEEPGNLRSERIDPNDAFRFRVVPH